jgi:uncharacterized protein (DUF1800 family)
VLLIALLIGCAAPSGTDKSTTSLSNAQAYTLANRITWGATPSAVEGMQTIGSKSFLTAQLHPPQAAELPAEVQSQIDSLRITQVPFLNLVQDMEQRNKDANAINDVEAKKTAQQAYQLEMNRLSRESATRHLLRALYSPQQVQEQMTWFWLNHFNIHQGKVTCESWSATTKILLFAPLRWASFGNCWGPLCNTPPCCATSTTNKMLSDASMRTLPVS